MLSDLLVLERAISESVALGVLSGQYSVPGGVVRNAAGHIVRHFLADAAFSVYSHRLQKQRIKI